MRIRKMQALRNEMPELKKTKKSQDVFQCVFVAHVSALSIDIQLCQKSKLRRPAAAVAATEEPCDEINSLELMGFI